ncbi:MAG: helix-turn-helix domain-containing protein [Planctomycetaceae bacterium]
MPYTASNSGIIELSPTGREMMNPNEQKEQYLTPPDLARRWGIKPEKVIAWIRAGELRAMDFSAVPGVGRPRYRIRLSDAESFEKLREVVPAVVMDFHNNFDWSTELS